MSRWAGEPHTGQRLNTDREKINKIESIVAVASQKTEPVARAQVSDIEIDKGLELERHSSQHAVAAQLVISYRIIVKCSGSQNEVERDAVLCRTHRTWWVGSSSVA